MKRQFKHKQSGDVMSLIDKDYYKGWYINNSTNSTVPGKYIENTNDWVEILSKPEYTILTLWAQSSTPNKYKNDRVLASYDNAEIGSYDRPLCKTYPTREKWLTYFHQPLWNIHSVRRENDGLVLTVGDNTPTGIIKSFILKENTVGYASGEHTSWVGLKVWRKIQLKEWEITSLTSPHGPVPVIDPIGFDSLLNNLKGYTIRSIKRLSDNVEFIIGDKVDSTISDLGRPTDLTGFKVIDNKLIVGLRHLGYYPLSTIILPKKPLFTTDDGVDVYENDTCYGVSTAFNIDKYQWKGYFGNKGVPHRDEHIFSTMELAQAYVNKNKPKVLFITEDGVNIYRGDSPYYVNVYWSCNKLLAGYASTLGLKMFSTEEKAKEYILMNKPCLSLQDVENVMHIPEDFDAFNVLNLLKKLVKTKL